MCIPWSRYIEIHGLTTAPELHDFVAWEMRTSVLETGSFSSSSALLNQIQSNCQWTARSNLMSLPTDCCQRDERRGWMGDAALGASVNFFNHEMTSFYDAFATLMTDDQGQSIDGDGEGAMPNWVPVFHSSKPSDFPGAGAPNWMTAYPTILYACWKHTGDSALVTKHWPHLQRYLAWYERKLAPFPQFAQNPFRRTINGTIATTQFPGDWCPPPLVQGMYRNDSMTHAVDIRSGLGESECGHTGWNNAHSYFVNESDFTSKPLSSAFSYLHDKKNIAEMGRAINVTGHATVGITAEDKQNFHAAFFHDGHFGSGGPASQSENIMPLLLGLTASDEEEQAVLDFVLRDIMTKHKNHTTSGIVGVRAMLEALPKLGRADVALSMLLRTDYPSFGYEVTNSLEPATTIWELFDGPEEGGSMDSRNHVMFATPSYFFFSAVAGVEPVVGSELWRVAPAVVGASEEVTEATATVWTPHGSLSTGWQLHSKAPWPLSLNVSVPVGLRVAAALPLPPRAAGVSPSAVAAKCSITIGAEVLWKDGTYVAKAGTGVAAGAVTTEARAAAIKLQVESGVFLFEMRCR